MLAPLRSGLLLLLLIAALLAGLAQTPFVAFHSNGVVLLIPTALPGRSVQYFVSIYCGLWRGGRPVPGTGGRIWTRGRWAPWIHVWRHEPLGRGGVRSFVILSTTLPNP